MIEPFDEDDVLLVNILSASAFAVIYLSLPGSNTTEKIKICAWPAGQAIRRDIS